MSGLAVCLASSKQSVAHFTDSSFGNMHMKAQQAEPSLGIPKVHNHAGIAEWVGRQA